MYQLIEVIGMPKRLYQKIWLIMRLTTVLLIACLMQVSAAGLAQKITLNERNVALNTVLKAIGKQSGYAVYFDGKSPVKSKKVTVVIKDASVEEALSEAFKGLDFTYKIEDKTIAIKPKDTPSFIDRLIERFQAIDVRGKVVDEKGLPIPGATVSVSGSAQGTQTNTLGEFVLTGVSDGTTITISFLGFEKKELTAKADLGTIVLIAAISPLDEVRVIAYGTTSQRLTTGNIVGIKSKDIETQPVANPLLTLAGRAAGVTVNQNSGFAGGGVTIRIQGINSISKGNDPFYVVDGVPYTSQLAPTLNTNILRTSGDTYLGKADGSGNPFSYLNAADIESIDILKDADATAIYGSRAASGAILITTKRGKAGQTKVDVSFQQGAGKVAGKMDMMNTQQFLEMRKEAYTNAGQSLPTKPGNGNYDLTVWDQNRYTDWQKELIGGTARYSDAQLSISGGSATTTFRMNAGYHKETTVFPGDFNDVKGSFGVNVNHSSTNQKFKAQFSANFLSDINKLPALDLTSRSISLAPNAPALRKSDGSINWERIPNGADSVSTWDNPLGLASAKYQNTGRNLISSLNLSYNIVRGLDFNTSFGYSYLTTDEVSTQPSSATKPELRTASRRNSQFATSNINSWIIEPQLSYNRQIFKGRLELFVGSTFQARNNNLQQYGASNFNNDAVITNPAAATTVTARAFIQNQYRYSAVFGRINYNWQDKYIVNFTARRDGSSRFGIENQFHNFGAIGAAWLFSNEEFFKNVIPALSFGKLRASYGTTGNDQIGEYAYLNAFENYDVVATAYQNVAAIRPYRHGNPYLQWELTKKFQMGLDVGFLSDRILLNVNYYQNRSSNQLVAYALPYFTGFSTVDLNFPANVENTGWEFMLNTINIKSKDFNWNTSFNLTKGSNKLLAFPDLATSTYANTLTIGQSVKVSRYNNFAGVNPITGLYEYYTADKSVTTTPDLIKDRVIPFDVTLPQYFGGFQNSFSYKGFQVDALFQFVKQKGAGFRYGTTAAPGLDGTNQPISLLDRWRKEGDQTDIQKVSTVLTTFDQGRSNVAITDASFIRLKNVSLSYSVPSKIAKRVSAQNLRLFIHGQNLFTITNFKGLDPETKIINILPPLRVYTIGIQATL